MSALGVDRITHPLAISREKVSIWRSIIGRTMMLDLSLIGLLGTWGFWGLRQPWNLSCCFQRTHFDLFPCLSVHPCSTYKLHTATTNVRDALHPSIHQLYIHIQFAHALPSISNCHQLEIHSIRLPLPTSDVKAQPLSET